MSALYILATSDDSLLEAWEKQLPPGRLAVRLGAEVSPIANSSALAIVVILDCISESALPASLIRFPTVFVGEPRSLPFEQARMARRAKVYFSYEESTTKLGDVLPLLEEMAEKGSMLEAFSDKSRRGETSRGTARAQTPSVESAEFWDFLEGALENLDSRERLLTEFRRACRHMLRASHAVFFFRDADGFRADRGTSFFQADDPLVNFFEKHPVVIDGLNWDGPSDPIGELAVRSRIALWGARLLVPVHDNGRLLGLVALGVRDDGQPYDECDRTRAIYFARLLRQCLGKSSQFSRLNHISNQVALGAKYLPGTLVLGPDENAPRHVPLIVRELIGQARRTHEVARAAPSVGQPFRAGAGIVAETGGVWAYWQESSAEVHDALSRERAGRKAVLRELALTLNHEIGNALVSLTTFRQATGERPMPTALIQTVKGDVAQLEKLNSNLGLMQALHEVEPVEIDVREVAQSVGQTLNIRVESGSEPVVVSINKALLEFSLRSLISAIIEGRKSSDVNDVAVRVRSTGEGMNLTALVSIKGRNLELEGILPEPTDDSVPNQGRLSVFLAKEFLRIHHGAIHAGPGMEGTEILISFSGLYGT